GRSRPAGGAHGTDGVGAVARAVRRMTCASTGCSPTVDRPWSTAATPASVQRMSEETENEPEKGPPCHVCGQATEPAVQNPQVTAPGPQGTFEIRQDLGHVCTNVNCPT